MENLKVLIDGIQKDVYGLFYIYNSKYYFVYTEKELDENGYVVLYMTQVGKETASTPNGPVDTGYMIGVEIADPNEQKIAQESISYIVEDKKNNTKNPKIQYLPINMLVNFKILSKKRFRLLKSIIVDNFKLSFDESINTNNLVEDLPEQVTQPIEQEIQPLPEQVNSEDSASTAPVINVEQSSVEPRPEPVTEVTEKTQVSGNIVVDYRTRFFEEEEKNKELQAQIDILTQKLNDIKNIIE